MAISTDNREYTDEEKFLINVGYYAPPPGWVFPWEKTQKPEPNKVNLNEHARITRLLRNWSSYYQLSIGIEMHAGGISQRSLAEMRRIETELGVTYEDICDYFKRL